MVELKSKADPERHALIRPYEDSDRDAAVALFTRINRELAPTLMRDRFEDYISTSVSAEISRLGEVFAAARRNAFWVVEVERAVVGMFGIGCRSSDTTELRRMYLNKPHRGRGIAQQMLQCAEDRARELGFSSLVLSTAEIQEAALAFYRKSGFELEKVERADTMSTRTVGGGLTRFHFRKSL